MEKPWEPELAELWEITYSSELEAVLRGIHRLDILRDKLLKLQYSRKERDILQTIPELDHATLQLSLDMTTLRARFSALGGPKVNLGEMEVPGRETFPLTSFEWIVSNMNVSNMDVSAKYFTSQQLNEAQSNVTGVRYLSTRERNEKELQYLWDKYVKTDAKLRERIERGYARAKEEFEAQK